MAVPGARLRMRRGPRLWQLALIVAVTASMSGMIFVPQIQPAIPTGLPSGFRVDNSCSPEAAIENMGNYSNSVNRQTMHFSMTVDSGDYLVVFAADRTGPGDAISIHVHGITMTPLDWGNINVGSAGYLSVNLSKSSSTFGSTGTYTVYANASTSWGQAAEIGYDLSLSGATFEYGPVTASTTSTLDLNASQPTGCDLDIGSLIGINSGGGGETPYPTGPSGWTVIGEYNKSQEADVWEDDIGQITYQGTAFANYTGLDTSGVPTVGGVIIDAGVQGIPAAPTNLVVTPSGTTASLTWAQSSGGGIINNTVYKYSGTSCSGSVTAYSTGGAATSYTATGLTAGNHYSFAVTGWNSSGQSLQSSCVSILQGAPPAPTSLTGSAVYYSISYTWNQATGGGITNNTIYVYPGGSCSGNLVAAKSTAGAATAYTVSSLTEDTEYAARVTAWNSSGQGPPSNCATITTESCGSTYYAYPTVLCESYTWTNYTPPRWPGYNYFNNIYSIARDQDNYIVSSLVPWHQQTIFYQIANGTLVGYDTATSTLKYVHTFPNNISAPSSGPLAPFQLDNGSLGAITDVGTTLSPNGKFSCYFWYAVYDFENGSYFYGNTSVNGCKFGGQNAYGELIDADIVLTNLTTGWLVLGELDFQPMYAYNIYTHHLSYTDSLVTVLNQGNSFTYVPFVDQVIEDNNQYSNNTVDMTAFNITNNATGGGVSFNSVHLWSSTLSNASGAETNNEPYFFWRLSSGNAIRLWGVGNDGPHVLTVTLYPNMLTDKFNWLNATGQASTTDIVADAEWTGSGYGLGGENCGSATYQVPLWNAATGTAILAQYGSGGQWFDNFFHSQTDGFICTTTGSASIVLVGTSGTTSAITYGGGGNGSEVMIYTANAPTPGAPTGLTVTGETSSSISLSWTNPNNGYPLTDTKMEEWSGGSCSGSGSVDDFGSVFTSYTWGGLAGSSTYSFEVAASTSGGYGPYSSCVSGQTSSIPPAPTNLAPTTEAATSIIWTWTQATGGGIVNDTLYFYSGSSCSGSVTAYGTSGAATSKTVSGLSRGTIYSAKVSAWNSTGQGPDSSCMAGTTTGEPPAPTGLSATSETVSTITWGWTQATGGGITNNTVYVFSGTSCAGTPTAYSTSGATTTKTVTGLAEATIYSAFVTAWNSTGQSPDSNCAPTETAGLPPAPTVLSVVAQTTVSITWTWVQATGGGIVNNTVYVFVAGVCGTIFEILTTGGAATSKIVSALSSGTTYSAKVTAWNATGQGLPSSCAAGTTQSVNSGGGGGGGGGGATTPPPSQKNTTTAAPPCPRFCYQFPPPSYWTIIGGIIMAAGFSWVLVAPRRYHVTIGGFIVALGVIVILTV